MKFNFWRQLRLAGGVLMIVGSWINRLDLCIIGFAIVMVGTINGLARVETILAKSQKEDEDEKTEA